MNKSDYHKAYWQAYKHRKKRVSVVLSSEEYQALKLAAKIAGNTLPQQLLSESRAYRNKSFIPSQEISAQLTELLSANRTLYQALINLQKSPALWIPIKRLCSLTQSLTRFDQLIQKFCMPRNDNQKPQRENQIQS